MRRNVGWFVLLLINQHSIGSVKEKEKLKCTIANTVSSEDCTIRIRNMIIVFWSAPLLTMDRLLFNILWTIWVVAATFLEEQDLADDFGQAYRDYQAKVPMLVPKGFCPAYFSEKPADAKLVNSFRRRAT